MNAHRQIFVLVALLLCLGGGMIAYKHLVLGFPLFPNATQTVWIVETRLDFDALGGPVTARVNVPETVTGMEVLNESEVAGGYRAEFVDADGDAYVEWQREEARRGPVSLYIRTELFFTEVPVRRDQSAPQVPAPSERSEIDQQVLSDVHGVIEEAGLSGQPLVLAVLRELNNPSSEYLAVPLRELTRRSDKLQLGIDLLAMQGFPARMVRGVHLVDRQKARSPLYMLEVWLDDRWLLFDPREVGLVSRDRFIPFQEGQASLYEVTGGENSSLKFSVLREQRAAFLNAVENAQNQHSVLVDFSIYSLPVAQQSTFKLLLLMPLGALVVVILRNLVGLRTSGTFMPILISLAFLQTGLLVGITLFLMVVGTGLLVRSYLTRLNLLLVPRIAAVLVFVIIIYGAIGIAGHKLGFEWGLKVTLFPMIILSWTIERMSILWDEEGAHEVFVQGGGSLLTASLAYLLMSNQAVADAIFLYPEALLVLLAIIIAIGSYSGYRLSDLRRFEPMERY